MERHSPAAGDAFGPNADGGLRVRSMVDARSRMLLVLSEVLQLPCEAVVKHKLRLLLRLFVQAATLSSVSREDGEGAEEGCMETEEEFEVDEEEKKKERPSLEVTVDERKYSDVFT